MSSCNLQMSNDLGFVKKWKIVSELEELQACFKKNNPFDLLIYTS